MVQCAFVVGLLAAYWNCLPQVEKLRGQLRDLGIRQPSASRRLVGRARQLDEAAVEDLIARYR